ncbi:MULTISPECIES: hypothetical protein [Arthrobacter]|nr:MULTISPECIES: hypothetical protein [Arthrobacter]
MVILQISGCEHIAKRVLAGQAVSQADMSVLAIANDLAQQKGYLPMFVLTGLDAQVSENAADELEKFFGSEEWQKRNRSSTRSL